jgi:N-acetylglutamate synthase-like GNAT family acetyltransferase/DNA-binding MarR family transcriptional regulator
MEFIKQMGELAFGTRLKLLTERLAQDAASVYRKLNIDFEPRWFTVFYLLSEKAPLSVSEISSSLGITQPAVTQVANLLIRKGLAVQVKDKTDTRKRILRLSEKGKLLLPVLRPVWEGFEDATKELFKAIGYDVILVVSRLESALDDRDLCTRIMERVKENQLKQTEIVEYVPGYKEKFKKLNYEWLNRYFKVEKEDRKMLQDPEKEILGKGGFVFFAKQDHDILGTAALIKHCGKIFELCKMAVTESARGRQIGKRLALSAIEKAKSLGAKKIFLETSLKLTAANNLYRKLGFRQVEYDQDRDSKYKRPTIKMELDIN